MLGQVFELYTSRHLSNIMSLKDDTTRVFKDKIHFNHDIDLVFVFTFFLGFGQFQNNRLDQTSQPRNGLTCPERNGRFAHDSQCDAYIECEDGVGEEKLCPDGLLFNPKARFFSYPCHYPIDVDCTGRPNLRKLQHIIFIFLDPIKIYPLVTTV